MSHPASTAAVTTGTLSGAAIDAAARRLEAGELVAFPTETVYGLGADAENPAAVAAIYRAKDRPSDHPVIVHLAPGADLGYWSSGVTPMAQQLMAAFWPGPLTLILPRAAHIPDAVSGGQTSIGLRCPSHPVAQALLRSFKGGRGGIAAPSANRFGHVSPTTAQHVRDEFGSSELVTCVLDGGQSEVGIESTIVDLTRGVPVLLRPGHVSAAELAELLGIWPALPDAAAPRASGTLEAHYAPQAPVALVATDRLAVTLTALVLAGRRVALLHRTELNLLADPAVVMGLFARVVLPTDAAGFAHDLYAALRASDQAGTELIVLETPPASADWHPVSDRLKRAAHGSTSVLAGMLHSTGN
ncbi:MAG: threonylcarbamoyl-AMP synthase [Herminiimonas sp.]|nr:threonylcarbamoyl-AMP synthase [Herminiimonas sp.]